MCALSSETAGGTFQLKILTENSVSVPIDVVHQMRHRTTIRIHFVHRCQSCFVIHDVLLPERSSTKVIACNESIPSCSKDRLEATRIFIFSSPSNVSRHVCTTGSEFNEGSLPGSFNTSNVTVTFTTVYDGRTDPFRPFTM